MTRERIPRIPPEDLTPTQRHLYEAITGGGRAHQARILPLVDREGRLEGPFGPLLHSPDLGMRLQTLGAQIRTGMAVDDRSREIATLWCAGQAGSSYEIAAHERLALSAGVLPQEVEALTSGSMPDSLSPREQAFALAAGRERWDDDDFLEARRQLELGEIVDAIVLGGYYRLLSVLLDAFGITEIGGPR